jgi:hypothetical protein
MPSPGSIWVDGRLLDADTAVVRADDRDSRRSRSPTFTGELSGRPGS